MMRKCKVCGHLMLPDHANCGYYEHWDCPHCKAVYHRDRGEDGWYRDHDRDQYIEVQNV